MTTKKKNLEQEPVEDKKEKKVNRSRIDNLVPPCRTTEEARKRGANGGKKSGEARRAKKRLREMIAACSENTKGGETWYMIMVKKAWDQAMKGDNSAREFVTKFLDQHEMRNATDKKRASIWRKLISGKITEKEASYLFNQADIELPESIKLQILKQDPVPEDPSKGQYATVSDEEMEQMVAAREVELAEQQNGLPERRQQMEALHKSVKDTYADNHIPKRPDAKQE